MNYVLKRPEIKKIILEVLNNNWNTDYVIRYVTVEISKLVQRDVSFFKMTDDEKLDILKELNYENSYPNVICKTLHELIRDVLDYLGIESKVVIATNTKVPLYALIAEGEHGRYFIDALNDLFKVQYNIQPVTYGNYTRSNNSIIDGNKLISLDLDYIREMDLDMGLIKTEYFSDYINRIKNTYIDRNQAKKIFEIESSVELLKRKIELISEKYLNNYPVEGPHERVGLHVYLRNNLFNKSEKKFFRVCLTEDNRVILKNEYGGQSIIYEEIKDNNKYILKKYNTDDI